MRLVSKRRDTTPVYSIGVVSDLSGLSVNQLRDLDAARIISPTRTEGGRRLYSDYDLQRAQVAAFLMNQRGIGVPGTGAILEICEALGYAAVLRVLGVEGLGEEEPSAR